MFKKNLPLIIIILVIFLAFGGFIYYQKNQPSPLEKLSSRELADRCTTDMATQFHIHSHLTIIANQQYVTVPANTGIDLAKNCMSSLHTHDTSGIIHVEAPVQKDFTLGDFFYKWGQPLSHTQILTYPVDSTHGLKVYVNGKETTQLEDIILQDHQDIVIDYYDLQRGPDELPAAYTWPADYQTEQDAD